MNNNATDLTSIVDIVIPTHNRIDFLNRILPFYNYRKVKCHIVVTDSSTATNKKKNKEIINSYPNLNITHITNFSSKLTQHIKFSQMVKYLNNKYSVFCPDDDFITPTGILDCVRFLEKNPDYSAAHGGYIGFHLFKGLFDYREFWWNFRYSNHTISDTKASRRVKDHLENFNLTTWAVRRTSDVKKSYAEFQKVKFDPYLLLMFGELLPDILISTFGKIKYLNTFYGGRQYFSRVASNYATFQDAINTGKYESEYQKFRDSVVNNLQRHEDISKKDAQVCIDQAMVTYLKNSNQEYLTNKIYRGLRNAPVIIYDTLILLHAKYLLSKDKQGLIGPIDTPSSKYYKEFDAIRKSVLDSRI